ncbi:Hypp7612 [Branchiostoma lanceolatum]|uniref:Hypp7612 protein n=1 Tax=Branchiostoma lanceolatum TaxID=7740 RepID=A0A8J9Z2H7_BRALA|nr:Hypp7612 [Branchiostoma lanceolatum]
MPGRLVTHRIPRPHPPPYARRTSEGPEDPTSSAPAAAPPGLAPEASALTAAALLLVAAWLSRSGLPRRPGMGSTLQRHPFSGLVDSAGFPLASPCSGIVHHLSGPNAHALARPHRRSGRDRPVVRPRRGDGGDPTSDIRTALRLHCASGFRITPLSRAGVRLLGPCLKTGPGRVGDRTSPQTPGALRGAPVDRTTGARPLPDITPPSPPLPREGAMGRRGGRLPVLGPTAGAARTATITPETRGPRAPSAGTWPPSNRSRRSARKKCSGSARLDAGRSVLRSMIGRRGATDAA